MRSHQTLTVLVTLIVLVAPGTLPADDASTATRTFSTVRIYFLNENSLDPAPAVFRTEALGSRPVGDGGAAMKLRFETVRLFLNDKFVGNAILRHVDVKPSFNLPPGEHKFRIECEGYRTFETKLEVLQNGSAQWLVVSLERPGDIVDSKVNGAAKP
jgi:hypothetical protein